MSETNKRVICLCQGLPKGITTGNPLPSAKLGDFCFWSFPNAVWKKTKTKRPYE